MPRQVQSKFAGAMYHVMARGDRERPRRSEDVCENVGRGHRAGGIPNPYLGSDEQSLPPVGGNLGAESLQGNGVDAGEGSAKRGGKYSKNDNNMTPWPVA